MKKKGFTIIELLIYLAIVTTVITSLVFYGMSVSDSRSKIYAAQEVNSSARQVMQIISQKIRTATAINNLTSNSLNLAMDNPAVDPTVIDLDQGRIRIQSGANPALPITSNHVQVTQLQFTDLTTTSNQPSIKIDISLQFNSSGSDTFAYDQTLSTTASLRH
jgi:type II secretory pathway pseudopilin PulG